MVNIIEYVKHLCDVEEREYKDKSFMSYRIKNYSKVFKIDIKLAMLLYNTDSKIEFKHLPFSDLIIDTIIDLGNGWKLKGAWLSDSANKKVVEEEYQKNVWPENLKKVYEKSNKELEKDIFSICLLENSNEKNIQGITICLFDNKNLTKIIKEQKEKIQNNNIPNISFKKIRMFILAFLNFLYNPDIEILERTYTKKQQRRRKEKGKYYTDHNYLKITGKTRRYVDSIQEEHFTKEYLRKTHCWIVRGYYMKLKHLRYKENIGKEIWVAPFIKGMGKPKRKEYLITDKKRVWMNQLKMENIIKEIFLEHLIISNTRGFLDGLEIDCYIPDLKLGFEYNGKQHYEQIDIFHKDKLSFKNQQERDKEKNRLAKEKEIKIITIRYDDPLTKEYILKKIKNENIKTD